MKEIRFGTGNLNYSDPSEDCYLDPSDPIHALHAQGTLGTLTPHAVAAAYDAHKRQQTQAQHFELRSEAAKMGIRPSTPAWFALTQPNRK
jgi:hypothetical protein